MDTRVLTVFAPAAVADGFVATGDCIPQRGYHYENPAGGFAPFNPDVRCPSS